MMRILTTNPLVKAFMRHATSITFFGYTFGNLTLFIKDLVQANDFLTWDMAAGAAFLICSTATKFAQKYPTASYRIIGGFCILGSLFLGVSALNVGTDLAINTPKLSGAAIQTLAGILWGMQKEIAAFADRPNANKANMLVRLSSKITRYPVAIAAIIDLLAGSGLLAGALVQPDPGMRLAMLAWYIGVGAMIATDPRIQKAFENKIKD